MATKEDFYPEDWKRIASAPIIAAAIISACDDVGEERESEDEEIDAFNNSMVKLRKRYRKNELIQAVIDSIEQDNTEEFEALFNAVGATESHESPLEDRVQMVSDSADLIDAKVEKKQAKEYKKFVMDAATEVASASKEGFFFLGAKISKKEEFFLRQLQRALGI